MKTRLCPPCSPDDASEVAEAALRDTLAAVLGTPGVEPVLVLDGQPGSWAPPALRTIPQRGIGLGRRLAGAFASAFEDARSPALIIGMDTPQVTPALLVAAVGRLEEPGVDAVLGDAVDGGWWAAGLRRYQPDVFEGVPMSTPHTARSQRERMLSLGLRVADLPVERDVDTFDDAIAVSSMMPPSSAFAATVRRVGERLRVARTPGTVEATG